MFIQDLMLDSYLGLVIRSPVILQKSLAKQIEILFSMFLYQLILFIPADDLTDPAFSTIFNLPFISLCLPNPQPLK